MVEVWPSGGCFCSQVMILSLTTFTSFASIHLQFAVLPFLPSLQFPPLPSSSSPSSLPLPFCRLHFLHFLPSFYHLLFALLLRVPDHGAVWFRFRPHRPFLPHEPVSPISSLSLLSCSTFPMAVFVTACSILPILLTELSAYIGVPDSTINMFP